MAAAIDRIVDLAGVVSLKGLSPSAQNIHTKVLANGTLCA